MKNRFPAIPFYSEKKRSGLEMNKAQTVKNITFGSFFLLGCSLANVAHAASLQECQELEKSNASLEQRYACWKSLSDPEKQPSMVENKERSVTKALLDEVSVPIKIEAYVQSTLLSEWNPDHEKAMKPYKQSYLIVANSSNPNYMPSSPNRNNQVPFTPVDNKGLKFQLSVKGKAFDLPGNKNSLWLAYTQQSLWQFFDSAHSRPFRENNYEPELIFSHRYDEIHDQNFHLLVANAGFVHQSNGQSNPQSRSWNRIYIQPGFEKDFSDGDKLIIQPKIWARVSENPVTDDNPDITHYLGYGELQVRYINQTESNKLIYQVSALAKIRSIQIDIDKPVRGDFNLHFQYFNGYGESLIDYNQRHSTFGAGVSLSF